MPLYPPIIDALKTVIKESGESVMPAQISRKSRGRKPSVTVDAHFVSPAYELTTVMSTR